MAKDTSSDADNTEFCIRVFLPDGMIVPLTAKGSEKFSSIRNQCWQKNSGGFQCAKTDPRFRLFSTIYYFNDDEPLSKLIEVYPCFEGLYNDVYRYSIQLESQTETGDKKLRQTMKADSKKPLLWQGYLFKCSKPTGKGFWQKRYFIIQSHTLLWYSNQEAFLKGQKAQKYLQLGGIIPKIDHPICYTTKQKNPMVLEIPPHYGHAKSTYILSSESEQKRATFIEALTKMVHFRQCVTVMKALPFIKPYVEAEGIFRLAGNSATIHNLQQQIDFGIMPNFNLLTQSGNPEDLHTLTGLFKRNLRFMEPPIVPHNMYENFVSIGRLTDVNERVNKLKVIVKSLPYKSLLIMSDLFPFLKFAAKRAAKSRMDAENLAIVIGPNLLRTNVDNPLKAMDDNDHIKAVVCTMIQYSEDIFPLRSILFDIDKATNPRFNQGLPNPQQGQNTHSKIGSFGGGIFDITNSITGQTGSTVPLFSPQTQNNSNESSSFKKQKDKRKSTGNIYSKSKKIFGGFKHKSNNNSNNHSPRQEPQQQPPPTMSDNVMAMPMPKGFGSFGSVRNNTGSISTSSDTMEVPGVTRPGSRSLIAGPNIAVGINANDLGSLRAGLKKTDSNSRKFSADTGNNSQQHDFRAKLKKTDSNSSNKKSFGNVNKVDFGIKLRKTPKESEAPKFFGAVNNSGMPKPNLEDPDSELRRKLVSHAAQSSQSLPPSVLKEQMRSLENKNEQDTILPVIPADIKLMPPPPPAHVSADFKKQEENDEVANVMQNFQDQMGEVDEEIEFLQAYAQELFGGIMEMADQGSIEHAKNVAKKMEQNCENVLKAAELQRDALREFNKYLETFLTKTNEHVTPGGPDDMGGGYINMDEEKNDGGLPSFNEMTAAISIPTSFGDLGMNPNANNHISSPLPMSQALNSNDNVSLNGGLPRFHQNSNSIGGGRGSRHESRNSNSHIAVNAAARNASTTLYVVKSNYDYPGGYRQQELLFPRGSVLLVTAEREGWLYGCYENNVEMHGWFPETYVHKIE